jgi:hypothetical protein
MAFTATQKQQIKKHLDLDPKTYVLDRLLPTLQDGGAIEAEVTASITECETTLAAVKTAQDASDDIASGAGAVFNKPREIAIKKARYMEAVCNLSRLVGWTQRLGDSQEVFYRL